MSEEQRRPGGRKGPASSRVRPQGHTCDVARLGHRIWVIAISLTLIFLSTGCATLGQYPEPPKVTLSGIQPIGMTLLEQRYLLKVRIQNPNDAALDVKGMSYEVALNGKEFAHGVKGDPFTVPGFGETVVEAEIVSTAFSFYEQIRQLQKNPEQRFRYEITGVLSLGGGGGRVPFKYEGELDFSPEDLGVVI